MTVDTYLKKLDFSTFEKIYCVEYFANTDHSLYRTMTVYPGGGGISPEVWSLDGPVLTVPVLP